MEREAGFEPAMSSLGECTKIVYRRKIPTESRLGLLKNP
jgi:hypothetical protein